MNLGILPAIVLLVGSLTFAAPTLAFDPTKLAEPGDGTSQTNPISFTTYGDEGTTWTQIWVYNTSTSSALPGQYYYHTAGNCEETKCAYTYTTPLAPGNYIWTARSWGPDNGGTYSDWTTPYSQFSVGIPGQVNPVAPPEFGEWYTGAQGFSNYPYSFQFRWDEDVLATEYEFFAIDSTGAVTNLTVPVAPNSTYAPIACSGFCSWFDEDAVQFHAGQVQWWVRGKTNGIAGPWSTSTRFWEGGVPGSNYGATVTPFTGFGANRHNLGGVNGFFIENWDVPAFNSEITDTWLYASNTKGGSDLHNQQYPISNRQATISGIGSYTSIWVRYWFKVAGHWYYFDFQYLNS